MPVIASSTKARLVFFNFLNGISRNTGKCELGGFSLRQSHILFHDELVMNDYFKELGIHQIQVSSLVYTEVVLIRIHISNWKLKATDG